MMKVLARRLLHVGLGLVAVFSLVFVGDMLVFKMRGSPHATVSVTRYLTVPLKGNKTEYDFQSTLDVPCAVAIFPQGDESPCWQLRKNPIQNVPIS